MPPAVERRLHPIIREKNLINYARLLSQITSIIDCMSYVISNEYTHIAQNIPALNLVGGYSLGLLCLLWELPD